MGKADQELQQGHTCWECLLRLLNRQQPESLGKALRMVHLAQKDDRYRPGWTRRYRSRK